MQDFTDDLTNLRRRLDDAKAYLRLDAAQARLVELEKEASEPACGTTPMLPAG